MTPGTVGRGDGTVHGTTAVGMTGVGMAIAIIHGLTGDVLGADTGVATGVATGAVRIIGITAGMAITITVVTTAVVQA